MNKEKDLVYLVSFVRSTLSMMFGWLYFYEKKVGKTILFNQSILSYHAETPNILYHIVYVTTFLYIIISFD